MEEEKSSVNEGMEMKLLTPLTGEFFPEDNPEWENDPDGNGEPLDGRDLAQYEDAIREMADKENRLGTEDGGICNLMDYFHGSRSVKEKVESAVVSVESAEGVLYGCTTLQIREYLESEELKELCDYITGQYSDGWGEGFEQREIQVDGGVLNVHFWQRGGPKFQIQAAEEKKPNQEKEKFPQENKKDTIRDRIKMKILTPLTGGFFLKDSLGRKQDPGGNNDLLDGRDLAQYEDAIKKAVDKENRPEIEGGSICDLMDDCFDGSRSIQEKVEHAVVSVENVEGVLYGCTTLQLNEPLESWELEELCEYIDGQYSDGWGEGFEQREIQVDGGILNVYFEYVGSPIIQVQGVEKKPRPKLQLTGHDGNIFSIVADAGQLLSKNGQRKEADEMYERVFQAGGYHEALGIISEYVETELSSVREKKNQKKQKQGKEPCR